LAAAGLLIGVVPLLTPSSVMAQTWATEVGVGSQFELTSNAELGEAGGRGDSILSVRPHIRLSREGGQFKFSGSASLDGIVYLNHTQPNRLQPQADLTASLKVVPRLVFLDADLRAFQTNVDPFGARQEAGSTSENSLTTVVARVTPRIEGTAGEHLRYLVRSDNAWLNEGGATASIVGSTSEGLRSASRLHRAGPGSGRLAARGAAVRNALPDSTLPPLVIDTARARSPILQARHQARTSRGYERSSFDRTGRSTASTPNGSLRPDQLAFGEHRFFGSAGDSHSTIARRIRLEHPLPAHARNLGPTQIDLLQSATSRHSWTACSRRVSRSVERARAVQDFITSRGLPTSTLQPIALRQQQLGILNLNLATVALIGIRNTVSLSGYHSRRQDALDASVIPSGGSSTNNTQVGASLAVTHQLTPSHNLTASADWSRITAPGEFGGERTTQQGVRLQVNMRPTPRTTWSPGSVIACSIRTLGQRQSKEAYSSRLDHRF
jgi:hypothetical protein